MRLAVKYSVVTTSALASVAAVVGGLTGLPAAAAPEVPSAVAVPAAGPVSLAPVERPRVEIDRSTERTALAVDPKAITSRHTLLAGQSKAIRSRIAAIKAKAAREKAALERLILEQGYLPGTTDPREIARQMMKNKYGWGEDQFACYNNIIIRESNWKWNADNPHSSAYGIPQALPGSKMASAGADWRTNPATQIKWGLGYVKDRFGTACGAWAFKRAHGWY